MCVHALIVAAGGGKRFGGEVPKQYLNINEQTVLEHSIQALASSLDIKKCTIVISKDDAIASSLPFVLPCDFVIGGAERADSVANGVRHLARFASHEDLVLIHDGARPCLGAEDLQKVIDVAKNEPNGAILGVPVADTLKLVNDGQIIKTQDRTDLWHAQTPQVFRLGKLLEVIDFVQQNNIAITDEAQGFELMSLPVAMVAGRSSNIKLTYPHDLSLVQFLLKGR